MKSATEYLWFKNDEARAYVDISRLRRRGAEQ